MDSSKALLESAASEDEDKEPGILGETQVKHGQWPARVRTRS